MRVYVQQNLDDGSIWLTPECRLSAEMRKHYATRYPFLDSEKDKDLITAFNASEQEYNALVDEILETAQEGA